jgi:chromosome partitioning protein
MTASRTCSVCGKGFEPRFRYQAQHDEAGGGVRYFCTQSCVHNAVSSGAKPATCSVCARAFTPEFAFQIVAGETGDVFFCTESCRGRAAHAREERRGPLRLAVFNHKGGTGKTTTSVNLAAGLAEAGKRVLLVDVDAQGNVGASLGIRGNRTMYHVLVLGQDPREAAVPVRANLEVITSNETLAAAELYLAGRPNRDRILRERMLPADDYDVVVLDCSPSLSLLNQNALVFADHVIIPVSCDYLSLVGVKQVIKTLSNVHEHLKHPVRILGVVPTFYDSRHKIGREVVETLKTKFGELCFPTVRANTKLREAPAAKQSIFEYAPDSAGADDYRAIVEKVLAATMGDVKTATMSQMEVA